MQFIFDPPYILVLDNIILVFGIRHVHIFLGCLFVSAPLGKNKSRHKLYEFRRSYFKTRVFKSDCLM